MSLCSAAHMSTRHPKPYGLSCIRVSSNQIQLGCICKFPIYVAFKFEIGLAQKKFAIFICG